MGTGRFRDLLLRTAMKRDAGNSSSANRFSVCKLSASLLARDAQVLPAIFVLLFLPCLNWGATPNSIHSGSEYKSLLPLRNSIPANTNVQV